MQMCAAVCLGAGSYMQNMAPKYPEGNLSDCLPWIMEGVFVRCLITVPAGCPPLCKAALWTHGTWPLCCGSCSRWIQRRSARESRLTLRGICRHNQNRVWQDILHHCSSMTITDTDCSWHTITIMYGVFIACKPLSDAHPLKLCSSIFSPRNSRNSTKAGLSSLFPKSSSSEVCNREKITPKHQGGQTAENQGMIWVMFGLITLNPHTFINTSISLEKLGCKSLLKHFLKCLLCISSHLSSYI